MEKTRKSDSIHARTVRKVGGGWRAVDVSFFFGGCVRPGMARNFCVVFVLIFPSVLQSPLSHSCGKEDLRVFFFGVGKKCVPGALCDVVTFLLFFFRALFPKACQRATTRMGYLHLFLRGQK